MEDPPERRIAGRQEWLFRFLEEVQVCKLEPAGVDFRCLGQEKK